MLRNNDWDDAQCIGDDRTSYLFPGSGRLCTTDERHSSGGRQQFLSGGPYFGYRGDSEARRNSTVH